MMYYRPSKETDKKWIWIVLVVVMVIVGILYTRTGYVGKVSGFLWERVFRIEKYQTVSDSGWSLPVGAFLDNSLLSFIITADRREIWMRITMTML
jgi:hypothetical protein